MNYYLQLILTKILIYFALVFTLIITISGLHICLILLIIDRLFGHYDPLHQFIINYYITFNNIVNTIKYFADNPEDFDFYIAERLQYLLDHPIIYIFTTTTYLIIYPTIFYLYPNHELVTGALLAILLTYLNYYAIHYYYVYYPQTLEQIPEGDQAFPEPPGRTYRAA